MSAKLVVNNLTYSYDGSSNVKKDAISDISFLVEKGEIIGVVGHTGSGKSTLVQQLNGLLKPTFGEVLLDGENIWNKPKEIRKVRSRVGLVFQYPEYQLFEDTVYDDIAFGPKNMGISGDELKSRVLDICRLLNIKDEYLDKSPFDLSGGEKRRVAIAGVMAMKPEVIVFDEPVAGLDPKGREDVIKMIYDYRNAYDATVLIVSHNMEDMALIADKLLVLAKGELLAFDNTENIFNNKEILNRAGLNPPIITRVMDVLRQKGINVPQNVFTVAKAVEFLSEKKGS